MNWEVFEVESVKKSAKVERGRIKVFEEWRERRVAVRVIENGRVGFVTSTEFDEGLIEKARKVARVSEEKLESFPFGEYVEVEGIYDKRVEKANPEEIANYAEVMVNSALDYGVNPSHGIVEFSVESVRLKNSLGTDMSYKSTYCSSYLECVYESSSGFEIEEGRGLVDFEFVGRTSAELALNSRNPKKVEGVYDLVISPIAVHQILKYTLYPSISLENVLKGRSLLTDLGKNYVGDLTLIDDGTLPGGLFTMPFDDEGVGVRRTEVFERGVLKGYITDFKNSLKAGIDPTGNCVRGDDLYPSVSPTNVILEFENVEKDLDGVYVHSLIGAHTSNPVTGDFSLETMNAFLKDEPVRAMIYGNVYELLKKITAFGKDVRQIENTVTPSIEVKDVRLI